MNTALIRIAAVSVALGGLYGALLAHPASASADAQSYLDDVRDLGFYHTDGVTALLGAGYAVCEMMSIPGIGSAEVVREVYINTGYSVSYVDARMLVTAALVNLCPEYLSESSRPA